MKKVFTLALILSFYLPAFSQSLGFYLNGSFPLNGLKDSAYRDGMGFSFEYISRPLVQTPDSRLQIRLGTGFEYISYGSAKVKDIVFNTPNSDKGYVLYRNSMTGFYLGPKLVFNAGRFSPYIDGFGAIRAFTTYEEKTLYQPVEGYETTTSDRKIRNGGVWQYGYSVGLLYRFSNNGFFDLRVSQSFGRSINFIDLNSVEMDPDFVSNVKYKVTTSPVSDILVFRLGIGVKIGRERKTTPRPASPVNPTPYQPQVTPDPNPTPAPTHRPAPQPKPATPEKKPLEIKPIPKPTPPPAPPAPKPNH